MGNFSRRIKIFQFFFGVIFLIFLVRLFELQILRGDEFQKEARAQHEKRSILPARRGKILVRKNRDSDEVTPLATNNTLKKLFVDPVILNFPEFDAKKKIDEQKKNGDPRRAAEILAPILINAHCEKIEGCEIETDRAKMSPTQKIATDAFERELFQIFSKIEREKIILQTGVASDRIEKIKNLNLRGIFIEKNSVIANPKKIDDKKKVAKILSPLLGISQKNLEKFLARKLQRYKEITNKIVPEISEKILELKKNPVLRKILRGVQLRDEHWRFYPEKNLAAQILGFVDSSGRGQYGIEKRFDHDLRGREGFIFGATSVRGQRILSGDADIFRARDGADILLSIDRTAQAEIEKILNEDTKKFDADFGQIIVVEPKTGKIIAMANSPTFNPNNFGEVFLRREISAEKEAEDREDEKFNHKIPTIFEKGKFFRYLNFWGPKVFRNKIVTDLYEPGSVMKAISMAAAIESDEVTADTIFDDVGPIEVDEFKINNADGQYLGETTMAEVINRSLNTGIAFITQKMGAKLLYKFFEKFGFGQYTDIEFDGELSGTMEHWKNWEQSELVTRGFGQGITATPLQMVMAFAALANGGYLMKPILVEEIIFSDGEIKKFFPESRGRIISQQTCNIIKSMLLGSVNRGIARGGKVFGYSVMGKTGTSQTYKNGKALAGEGTTITSFAGFGPFENPQFVILVKFDYPKISQWGSETAAATFARVAKFLFSHFSVPPDR